MKRLTWIAPPSFLFLIVLAGACASDPGQAPGPGAGPWGTDGGSVNPQGGNGNPVTAGDSGTTAGTGNRDGGAGPGSTGGGGNASGGTIGQRDSGTGNTSSDGGTPGQSDSGGGSSDDGSPTGGGDAGTPAELKCSDPVYGNVTVPAINMVSDFETGSLFPFAQDGRGTGGAWYAFAVDDVNDANGELTTPSVVNPKHATNNFKVDTTQHGPCSKNGALRVSSPGKAGMDSYTGFGIDFVARTSARKKQTYDASKYTGIGFWAKCAKDAQFVYFKTTDAAQDADISPPPCTYAAGTCNQYGIKNTVITKDWTYYKVYFAEALQDPNGKNFGSGVDKSKLTAFQIYVSPLRPRSGSPQANPFDCHVDDVHLLSEPAPATPSANVTWTTSGNKIMRNGTAHKIRGLVRPSMEWDYSGFGVTREDMQRMKKWHPNAVRLAVKDTLWKGGSTGSVMGDGAAYQRNVKRAVNWGLQQQMDVILDLHYVAGAPSADHAAFWDSVSKDAFFKDGRIIFELYNEPTADFGSLRSWMLGTIQRIRANGANNLILVGGVDYSYDISGYASNPITGQGAIAYVTHPYTFKGAPGDDVAFLTPAKTLPVVATEFGDANVEGFRSISPTSCDANLYSTYIDKFESAGMGWTSWAWIVDEWGCGFPQLILDYSGAPNAIGTPVQKKLMQLNP